LSGIGRGSARCCTLAVKAALALAGVPELLDSLTESWKINQSINQSIKTSRAQQHTTSGELLFNHFTKSSHAGLSLVFTQLEGPDFNVGRRAID
jgi:hypothetical protein